GAATVVEQDADAVVEDAIGRAADVGGGSGVGGDEVEEAIAVDVGGDEGAGDHGSGGGIGGEGGGGGGTERPGGRAFIEEDSDPVGAGRGDGDVEEVIGGRRACILVEVGDDERADHRRGTSPEVEDEVGALREAAARRHRVPLENIDLVRGVV